MDIQHIRNQNLHKILNVQFGGVMARFARAIDKNPNQVRFLLYPDRPGGRRLGERQAREIEQALGMTPYVLDTPSDGSEIGSIAKTPQTPSVHDKQAQIELLATIFIATCDKFNLSKKETFEALLDLVYKESVERRLADRWVERSFYDEEYFSETEEPLLPEKLDKTDIAKSDGGSKGEGDKAA